jgi:DNA-binding NarL/FixJ family response regulator
MVRIRVSRPDIVNKTPVVIVDDHQIVRQGLRGLIDAQPDLSVVGEAETGAGALQCIALMTPSLVVLDLQLPDISGLDVLAAVSRDHPKARVLVFSSLPSDLFAAAVVEAGAAAYVSKGANSEALLEALRSFVRDIRGDLEGRQWH